MPTRLNQFSHPMPPQTIPQSALQLKDIPFPPSSSFATSDGPHLHSTLTTLQTLVAFYEDERVWLYQQRTSLDDSPPSPDDLFQAPDNSPQLGQDVQVKAEPSHEPIPSTSKTRALHSASPKMKYNSRKPNMKLKLHKLPPLVQHKRLYRRTSSQSSPRESTTTSVSLPGIEAVTRRGFNKDAHVLDLFEEMMEDRLESCHRIDRLVRNAKARSLLPLSLNLRQRLVVPVSVPVGQGDRPNESEGDAT